MVGRRTAATISKPTITKPLAPGLEFEENQRPGLLLAGWNHRWRPGSNTLFLGGRLSAEPDADRPALQPTARPARYQRHAPGFHPMMHDGFDKFTDPVTRRIGPTRGRWRVAGLFAGVARAPSPRISAPAG